jgi:hypothetical protein
MDQIWTFNLCWVYIYADNVFLYILFANNVFSFYGLSYSDAYKCIGQAPADVQAAAGVGHDEKHAGGGGGGGGAGEDAVCLYVYVCV